MVDYRHTPLAARTVEDIMQHRVRTVSAETPLSEVARLLWDEQVSGAPVVAEDGSPIGFVSTSDLARFKAFGPKYRPPGSASDVPHVATPEFAALAAVAAPPAKPHAAPGHEAVVRDVMTPATFSVRPGTSVYALARFLTRAGIHRALVIEDGRLEGIVSAFDIVGELARYAPEDEQPDALRTTPR
jgi:CBS domain-containing protein